MSDQGGGTEGPIPTAGGRVRTPRIPHQHKVVKLFLSNSIPAFSGNSTHPQPFESYITYKRYQLLKVDAYVQWGIRSFG